MAYRKPAWFIRNVFNPIAVRLNLKFAAPLEVARRSSGGIQQVPLTPVEVDGQRYIVSARGETQWVKNLRAAGGDATLRKERIRCSEVPVAERDAILRRYQQVAGAAVKAHFKALPDAADHPVFRY